MVSPSGRGSRSRAATSRGALDWQGGGRFSLSQGEGTASCGLSSSRVGIEVVDLMKKPQRAKDDQIIAIPTLCAACHNPFEKSSVILWRHATNACRPRFIPTRGQTDPMINGGPLKGLAQWRRRSKRQFQNKNRRPICSAFIIAGGSQRSLRAVKKIKEICEKEIHGLYTLEIIDLYQQPARAYRRPDCRAPTLVRRLPEPIRLVGDLSDDEKVMALFKPRNPGRLK